MMQMKKMIECAIKKYIPGCSIQTINDKGTWIKKIFEITLDTGEIVFLKLKVHPDWGDLKHEIAVEKIFNDNGLPAPNTLAFDISCEIIPYPFVIQERMDGIRLDSLLLQSSKKDRLAIYESIGCLYRQLHKITNDHLGLWSENPKQILYPISPNDYMYQAEIKNGSGKLALERGRIIRQTYDRIVDVWAKNMENWGDKFVEVVKVQMVYDGQVAGRISPSYPIGTDDYEKVEEAIKSLLSEKQNKYWVRIKRDS